MMTLTRAGMIVLGAVALAGCNTTGAPAPSEAGPPPANYRAAAADYVKMSFNDPYSIRDATISEPLYRNGIFTGSNLVPLRGWAVCIRANAKNRMGAYIGQSYTLLLFRGEQVDLSLSGPDTGPQVIHHCKDAVMSPFPEIEAASGTQ